MDNNKQVENNRPKGRKKVKSEGGSGVEKKKPLAGVNPFGSGGVFDSSTKESASPQQSQKPTQAQAAQAAQAQAAQAYAQQQAQAQQAYTQQQAQAQAAQQQAYAQQQAQAQAQAQAQQQAYAQQQAQAQAAQAQAQAQQQAANQGKPQSIYGSSSGSAPRRSMLGCLIPLILLLVLVFIGSRLMKSMNSGSGSSSSSTATNTESSQSSSSSSSNSSNSSSTASSSDNSSGSSNSSSSSGSSGTFTYPASLLGGQGWANQSNSDSLITTVESGARDKFTQIKGNGEDTVTIMVYMCGTDLESQASMGTSDLVEMQSANLSDKVNLIIYTGGCKRWNNNLVSSNYNQVFRLNGGRFETLIENAGAPAMTDPSTLSSFIKWAHENFPADRNELILWDHGGGSISGYGYDEKYSSSGSMTLAGIDEALEDAGVKFDFVGFDACLMATAETGLVLSDHADYLIASEEVEPGIGWYYTDWLTKFSANTSTPTLEVGQMIADDFVAKCRVDCPGQETTLSVVDLAELAYTLPDKLAAFSTSTNSLIESGNYSTVASARSGSREFSRSTKIDQIDLVHFAALMKTQEGEDLANAVLSAVKYNKTSSNSVNAYGLSIYFPYKRLSQVDSVASIYNKIGIDSSYTTCIKHFAQMQVSGQSTGYGYSSPISSLLDELYGNGGSSSGSYGGYGGGSTAISGDLATALLESLLGGRVTDFSALGIDDLNESNTKFLSEDPLDVEVVSRTISGERISAEDLTWKTNSAGEKVISMSEAKWAQIQSADLAMYFDDGEGLIELGLDNVFDFDDAGNMISADDGTWLSIDGYSVAYYHISTVLSTDGEYVTLGYVPMIYNDIPAQLILVFTDSNPEGAVAGVRFAYTQSETETAAKPLTSLQAGDRIVFVCDYYDYSGNYAGSYSLTDTLTVTDPNGFTIRNTDVQGNSVSLYRFTDIYDKVYWTPVIQ